MTRTINGAQELEALVGQELGTSHWFDVTQQRVDLFAESTGDHQWIHVDPIRARSGPFGGTIAHGYLTLSLIPALLSQTVTIRGFAMGLNYGLNKVRFPTPVRVGSRVRLRVHLSGVEPVTGGLQTTMLATVEIEGADRPACVAEPVFRWMS